jgi:hypothetical protein
MENFMKKALYSFALATLAMNVSAFASNNDKEDKNSSLLKQSLIPHMRTGFNLVQETPEENFRRRYTPVVEELNQLSQEDVQRRVDRLMNFLHTVPTQGALLHVPQDVLREIPVKYINAVDFREDDDQLTLSKKYLKLGLVIGGLKARFLVDSSRDKQTATYIKNRLMAILFIKAGYKMSQVAENAESSDKADLYLSTSQLYNWAAYRLSFSPTAQQQWYKKAKYYEDLGFKELKNADSEFIQQLIHKLLQKVVFTLPKSNIK